MRIPVLVLAFFFAAPLAAQEPVPTSQDTVRANVATARTDLRMLVVAQEAYFADHGRYATSLDSVNFRASRSGSVAFLVTRANGWSAVAKRDRLVGNCVIFVNLPEADRPKTERDGIRPGEGDPRCDSQPELAAAAPAPTVARPPLR